MSKQIYILCPFAKDSTLYQGWCEKLHLPAQLIANYRTDWTPPDDAALVISHMHYRYEEYSILRKVVSANRVPVLILADGVLDYRNSFDNPTIADGSLFQPVIGHKIACLGRAQTRLLESWGNVGKCETVGMPRLDHYLQQPAEVRKPEVTEKEFRVLIATATTPYFTDAQRQATLQGLTELKSFIENTKSLGDRQIRPVWRLTEELDSLLGIKSESFEDLFGILDSCDAIVTTPSTIILEGWLKNRPVATLDYLSTPQFVPTAYTINSSDSLEPLFNELASPSPARILFQQSMLQDQLECATPAGPRMISLVNQMAETSEAANGKFDFPVRMLDDPQNGFGKVSESFDLRQLYPKNDAFRHQEMEILQIELAQATLRLKQLPDELLENREYIRYLASRLDEIRIRLQQRNMRVWDLRQEVTNLEKQIQTLKDQQDQPASTEHNPSDQVDS